MKTSRFLSMLLCVVALQSRAQNDPGLLARLTAPVEVTYADGITSSGTGFFFDEMEPPANPNSNSPQWQAVTGLWLITNRHVILADSHHGFGQITELKFFLRKTGTNGTDWFPVTIQRTDLATRLHFHPNPQVDVAALNVLDLVNSAVKNQITSEHTASLESWFAVSKDNFPGVSKIPISSGDDVIVVGYPKLFFDEYNKLPILKRGLLITPWGVHYRGMDEFLIDYKGFHGSSGSIVISKPTDLIVENGQLMSSTTKQFLFLGIYSGEPEMLGARTETDDAIIQEKNRVDLGQAWYYYTVQQTISAPTYDRTAH